MKEWKSAQSHPTSIRQKQHDINLEFNKSSGFGLVQQRKKAPPSPRFKPTAV
jgi:hypothetical protein